MVFEPGVRVRLSIDSIANLDAAVPNDAHYETDRGLLQIASEGNANVITLGSGTSQGTFTQVGTAATQVFVSVTTMIIGPGGGLLEAPKDAVLNFSSSFGLTEILGAGNKLTIGSIADVDGQVKTGTVSMAG